MHISCCISVCMQVCFIAFGHQTNQMLIVEDAPVTALTPYFEVDKIHVSVLQIRISLFVGICC